MRRVDDEAGAAELAAAVLDPTRERPIVAVTTRAGRAEPEVDLASFVAEIGARADVYVVATGAPTWELAERLPERFEVYGGALRIWWPALTAASDPLDHPLFLVYGRDDGVRKARELLAELVPGGTTPTPRRSRPQPGEIVDGIVTEIAPYGVFLDVHGFRGLVHISELADEWIAEPGDHFAVGNEVRARVLDTPDGRFGLSFRASAESADARRRELEDEVARLKADVKELAAERRDLLHERRRLQERVRQLERSRRTERGRGEDRALTEEAFRAQVAAEYEARYVGDDRSLWPLRRYALHPRFLESIRQTEGVSVAKVVEVSTHVVTRRAHELDGLATHQLHRGGGGAPQMVRARDGAKAWRCALQRESAGARRLHWWELADGSIELASVGHHDDVSIPE